MPSNCSLIVFSGDCIFCKHREQELELDPLAADLPLDVLIAPIVVTAMALKRSSPAKAALDTHSQSLQCAFTAMRGLE